MPGVADNIDPNKSFWKEYVTYPYPVKYKTAKDKRGTSWQIGYMDEYAGTDQHCEYAELSSPLLEQRRRSDSTGLNRTHTFGSLGERCSACG